MTTSEEMRRHLEIKHKAPREAMAELLRDDEIVAFHAADHGNIRLRHPKFIHDEDDWGDS